MFEIKKYNKDIKPPKDSNITVFWVQCVGNNSGKPLRKPIPNSWEIRTDREIDFQILYCVYVSKILNNFLIGSTINFIRLKDYKKIIQPILKNAINEDKTINKHYLQIEKIEECIANKKNTINLMDEMRKVLAYNIIHQFKKENAF